MRISIMTSTAKNLRRLAIGAIVATAAACSADSPSQTTEPRSGSPVARGAIAVSADVSSDAAQNQLLASVRGATAAYHRVDAAIADGYVLGSPCEAMPGQGIGIHYRKGVLIDGVVDPAQPELLVYEPRKNGNLELVAVAFVVRASAWDPTHTSPPMLGNQVFEDKRVPDWSSPPFPNYELHVWVWKHNPNGMYATTNPLVSCEAAP
jgi:hypothetical protein